MNERDFSLAIKHIRPTAEFTFNDTDYDSIVWIKLEGEPPTLEEIIAADKALKLLEQQQITERALNRQALLDRLGITEEEAKLLLG